MAPYRFPASFPCFFCEYMAARLPWYPLEQGEDACAFLNVRQRSRGAILVAPRRHVNTLTLLTETEIASLMEVVRRAGAALTRAVQPDGLHVFCNAGRAAGQSEAHVHFQVIPRYDGIPYSFSAGADFPPARAEEARAITALIQACYPSVDAVSVTG